MKKPFISAIILFVIVFSATSCGSPLKKRKACKGNGSWYGNRHLGAVDQNSNTQDVYRLTASVD
jgi:hypothetical protein